MSRFFTRTVAVCLVVALGVVTSTFLHAQSRPATETDDTPLPRFNQLLLELAASYPDDGTHTYWWPRSGESSYDGCTRDIVVDGKVVMKGEEGGRTFCCGLTLEVFAVLFEQLRASGQIAASELNADNFADFKRVWFVLERNGPGPSAALEKYKLGREIPASEVLPGDMVQIWRTPNRSGNVSGHSVVFLDWVRNDADKIVGLKYWSTQTSTQGIGVNTEYFGPMGGMSTEFTTYGRVEIPGWETAAGN